MKNNKTYVLRNGIEMPWIAFGTGVIWKYTRSPIQFMKYNVMEILSTIRRGRMPRELEGNIHIKQILNFAYNSGYRMFDTARIYGKSEKKIGATVAKNEDVFIASKCSVMDVGRNGTPNSVDGNFEQTLKNLGRDTLDLYLLHWPEGKNWLKYYRDIVNIYKAGKCHAFGVCNINMDQIGEIIESGLELPMVIQEECHPFYTRSDIRQFCKENKIQFEAHTPTTHMNKCVKNNETLKMLSGKYKKTIVQIILRWHYQNDVIPVISSFTGQHMRENMDIFDFELSDEDMDKIEGLNDNLIFLNTNGIDNPKYIYND